MTAPSVIVVTREELAELIREAVRQALGSGPQPDRWLSLSDAAREIGVDPSTIHRWAERGEIPADAMRLRGTRTTYSLAWCRQNAKGSHV